PNVATRSRASTDWEISAVFASTASDPRSPRNEQVTRSICAPASAVKPRGASATGRGAEWRSRSEVALTRIRPRVPSVPEPRTIIEAAERSASAMRPLARQRWAGATAAVDTAGQLSQAAWRAADGGGHSGADLGGRVLRLGDGPASALVRRRGELEYGAVTAMLLDWMPGARMM